LDLDKIKDKLKNIVAQTAANKETRINKDNANGGVYKTVTASEVTDPITDKTHLKNDLGLDSLDIVEINYDCDQELFKTGYDSTDDWETHIVDVQDDDKFTFEYLFKTLTKEDCFKDLITDDYRKTNES